MSGCWFTARFGNRVGEGLLITSTGYMYTIYIYTHPHTSPALRLLNNQSKNTSVLSPEPRFGISRPQHRILRPHILRDTSWGPEPESLFRNCEKLFSTQKISARQNWLAGFVLHYNESVKYTTSAKIWPLKVDIGCNVINTGVIRSILFVLVTILAVVFCIACNQRRWQSGMLTSMQFMKSN